VDTDFLGIGSNLGNVDLHSIIISETLKVRVSQCRCYVESKALLIVLIVSGLIWYFSPLPPQPEGYETRLLVLVREHKFKNKWL
jgi:hypothetical protein